MFRQERRRHDGRWLVSSRVGGQPLQECFEYQMQEAKKCPQQPSNGPQKMDTTFQIFQKKLQRTVYLCLCYGQASCWVSVQCKFSHFSGGFAVLQISTSSLLCTGDLGRHRDTWCYKDYTTQFKTIIKKTNGFQVCCLQVSSKIFRAVLQQRLRWRSHRIYLVVGPQPTDIFGGGQDDVTCCCT